ncbi:MAG: hypothetical protein FVQ80_09045 [Planctomycetes bacterium]|nr:hypothetical protein [Planctomycetota bacterium]
MRIVTTKAFGITAYLFISACILSGCQSIDAQYSQKDIASLSAFNRGAGFLDQYRYKEAAKEFEEVLRTSPGWVTARFNLGVAYFNLYNEPGAEGYLDLAREAFESVSQSPSYKLNALFCLGLYYQHIGNDLKSEEYFRAVYKGDDKDPYVMYKLAEVLISLGRTEEGTEFLEKTVELDPGFISAIYRLASQYQRTKRREQAKPLFMRFRKLKEAELAGGTFTAQKSYGASGKYYMALGADEIGLRAGTVLPKRVIFSPQARYLDSEITAWKWGGGTISLAGIAGGDVDGDGDLDILMTGFGDEGKVQLWRNNGSGEFSGGAYLAEGGISPCFGDVDDDGDIDLWLGRAGEDLYFENDGKGNFKKIRNQQISGGNNISQCVRLVDIDSDGDLDFLALRMRKGSVPITDKTTPTASSLYNNNRDGSFTDIAEELGLDFAKTTIGAVIYDDFDNDRDLDMILFPANGTPISWVNDRLLEYRIRDAASTGLSVGNVLSATSGDPDKDGDRDLLVFTGKGLHLFVNDGNFKFKSHKGFADHCGRLGGTGGQFADFDNDGDLDILIADAHRRDGSRGPVLLINDWPADRFVNASEIDPGNMLGAIETKGDASCMAADFTGNGKCDVLLAWAGAKPVLLENMTPGGHWIEIDLIGTREQDKKSRSNNSAIGARVDIKAGNISQQYVVGSPTSSTSLAPYRIHAGLGDNTKVDWLRIMWPDGVLQAELELAADELITITELQRKTSSCPHLFAWDGSHFAFISDFGGMGGMGYLLGKPGEYAKPDPTEYVSVPNLVARDGEYVLQVLEPLEEVVYFDEAKLIAVDHPAGTQVYPNEMMAVNIALPEFELFCFEDTIDAIRAVDHRNVDVTEKIRTIDRRYAGTTELDRRFTGFAKEHFVELDFGERLESLSGEQRLVLFLYGWVEYGYSSTNFAASQANMSMKAPTIEVLRDGGWVELFNEVGYPAGINHMMTLDVTGKILPSDSKIRISSNMEIYWDRIFLAEVLDESRLSVREVSAKNADLHFLGFLREFSPDGRHPKLFDYDSVDRAIPWKIMSGDFTRFGEVTELIEEADDRYVIMGRGEELTLRFSAESFGTVPAGMVRSFILKTDSFCKDMDFCSAYPDTVEPLPFHGMSNYPYGENEKYPDDEKMREYQRRFNTRKLGDSSD